MCKLCDALLLNSTIKIQQNNRLDAWKVIPTVRFQTPVNIPAISFSKKPDHATKNNNPFHQTTLTSPLYSAQIISNRSRVNPLNRSSRSPFFML